MLKHSFWKHFLDDETVDALAHPEIVDEVIAGHKQYFSETDFDFYKLMSDGYFIYPSDEQQQQVWIDKQIELVNQLLEILPEGKDAYYNIFSPEYYTLFKYNFDLTHPLDNNIIDNVILLVSRLLEETSIKGIYYSTRSWSPETKDYDLQVLNTGAQAAPVILHICGYDNYKNDLKFFENYPVDIISYAANVENVSIAEAQKLFPGKVILGGFGNSETDVLFSGTDKEIEAEIKKIVAGADLDKFILGADCTINRKQDLSKFKVIQDIIRKEKL
jgi:uroporphyrinogen decarboxylase